MTEYVVGYTTNGKFVVLFSTYNIRLEIIKRRKLEVTENKSLEIKKRA